MLVFEPSISNSIRRFQKKRNDIQVLRFVAIAAVLGFHLRPKSVPQGYLGVDIFFVISGYLMTVITASSNGVISIAVLLHFYERRLKRLCPTYVLTILATIVVAKYILIATDFETLRSDSFWALAFGTNIQSMLAKENYFQLVSDYRFLLHTWSLGVEVQFYVAAPFMLALIARSGYPLITCGIISGFSLAFQTFVFSPTWAFGCVLSRIWQFLIGTAVFYYEKRREQANNQSNGNVKVICGTILLVTLLLMPEFSETSYYKVGIRVLATSLTGILMYYAPTVNERQSLRSISAMTLMGDASYSIYLVHWPMIIFAQYLDVFDYTTIYTQLACILLVAFILYYMFEKHILSCSTAAIFAICGVLYLLATTLLLSSYNIETPETSTKIDVRKMDPILGNEQLNKDCVRTYVECPHVPELDAIVPKTTVFGAYFCGFWGHGRGTILVGGNSYALYQLEAVQKALKGQYKTLYFAARLACLTFDAMNEHYSEEFECGEVVGLTEKILKALKPDVMLIIQRYDNNYYFNTNRKIGNTTIEKHVESELAKYSKYTKKILIVEPNKPFQFNVPLTIAKNLQNGQPLESIFYPLKDFYRIDHSWRQVLSAMKSCSKCEPLWIREHLCQTQKCLLYEKESKLALYCDTSHLSTIGNEKIMPAYRAALKKAFHDIFVRKYVT